MENNNNGVTIGVKRERKQGNNKKNTGAGSRGESEKDAHIITERERRKKMRNMFSGLHALLPQVPPKADKITIVDGAVNYIKSLEQTLHDLQQRKLQITKPPPPPPSQKASTTVSFNDSFIINDSNMVINDHYNGISDREEVPPEFQTWTSANVILNVYGEAAQISICTPSAAGTNKIAGRGVFSVVCSVLEKYNIDVLTAHVASMSHRRRMFMLQVRHRGRENIGAVAQGNFGEAISVEGIYKDAANEMISCLSCFSSMVN
ncbi:Transcription factor bHLH95 [Linum grandiflorum]